MNKAHIASPLLFCLVASAISTACAANSSQPQPAKPAREVQLADAGAAARALQQARAAAEARAAADAKAAAEARAAADAKAAAEETRSDKVAAQVTSDDGRPAGDPVEVQVEGLPQDFAFDAAGKTLYLQSLRIKDGKETGFISRQRIVGNKTVLEDSNIDSEHVGHQGISVQSAPQGQAWMWVSRHGDHGQDAARFIYEPNKVPDKVEVFTFFDTRYMKKNVTMPKVCFGGKQLMVRGRITSREHYIRVFNLADLKAPGDYSSRAVHEWAIPRDVLADGTPVQGLACDRSYAYVVLGHAKMDDKKTFLKLKLRTGELVQKVTEFKPMQQMAVADGKQFEPEGISVLNRGGKDDKVYVGFLSGNSRGRKFRLWPFAMAR